MDKKWLYILGCLMLVIGLINFVRNTKDIFSTISEAVKYEPIYKTVFDDKEKAKNMYRML